MSAPTAAQIQSLRQATYQASKAFASYNFRQYFVRRTALRFDAAPALTAPELPSWYQTRLDELQVLKRASTVNRLFEGPKLVVEKNGVEETGEETVEDHQPLPGESKYTC